jgi:CSLREA domain-containing protein
MTNHHRRRRTRSLIAAACLLGARATAWCAPLTFTVNSVTDAVDATPGNGVCATAAGKCTLRAAIQESNAHAGLDTIIVPAGTYVLSLTGPDEDFAVTGDLDITDAVTITGAGASAVIIDGNNSDRVFDIYPNGTTTISGVTIRNGNPGAAHGGAILSAGEGGNVVTLNLSNVIITGNTAVELGGGIASSDVLSLTDVTVSNNVCAEIGCFGGGLYNAGPTTLNRVTVSGNSATAGGGGIGADFDLTLTNVTLSGNSANLGAAIEQKTGLATLTNVTIKGNTASAGGGAFLNLSDATFQYSIFAHVPAGEACMNLGTSFVSTGHNIDVGTGCGLTGTGDLSNTDPLLGPLQNNGGPTQTHALLAGSPAIDAGGNDCPPPLTDQRGTSRPLDGNHDGVSRCDIGAYELNPSETTTTTTSTSTSTTTIAVRCGDVNGDGAVNIGDALIVAQYDVGLRTCGQSPFGHPERCDVNRDGGCNIGDALRMAQCDVGLVSCNFTCGTFSCP